MNEHYEPVSESPSISVVYVGWGDGHLFNHWRVGIRCGTHQNHIDVMQWPPFFSLRVWIAKRKLIRLWRVAQMHSGPVLSRRRNPANA